MNYELSEFSDEELRRELDRRENTYEFNKTIILEKESDVPRTIRRGEFFLNPHRIYEADLCVIGSFHNAIPLKLVTYKP